MLDVDEDLVLSKQSQRSGVLPRCEFQISIDLIKLPNFDFTLQALHTFLSLRQLLDPLKSLLHIVISLVRSLSALAGIASLHAHTLLTPLLINNI